jgi:translation initiation factor IF-3
VSPIRLIGPDGEQVGIIPTREALERAREAGLDLVEVSPNARPPVCRILDYGKYKYNQAKKAASSRKRQHVVSVKGMRFRPKIEEHDYQFKKKHVQTFLEQGNKVKCFVLFRGREKAHTEFGRNILDRLAKDLEEIASVENSPRMEGHSMNMLLAPLASAIKQPPAPPPSKKSSKSTRKSEPSKPVTSEEKQDDNNLVEIDHAEDEN